MWFYDYPNISEQTVGASIDYLSEQLPNYESLIKSRPGMEYLPWGCEPIYPK